MSSVYCHFVWLLLMQAAAGPYIKGRATNLAIFDDDTPNCWVGVGVANTTLR